MFSMLRLVLSSFCFGSLVAVVSGIGTTGNIEEIFIGRCWEYQRVLNPREFLDDKGGLRDCSELWTSFSQAFKYKSDCNVTVDSYTPFAEAAVIQLPNDLSMFWSGVYQTQEDYNEVVPRYTVISDTLHGYVVDGLEWCGKTEDPGIDYEECTPYGDCELGASLSFWRSVSITFARHAHGSVRVMLNGTNGHAYKDTSVFAQYELPNWTDNVTVVHVLVIHAYGQPVKESCTNGTLVQLKSLIEGRGFRYNCTDDPTDIRYLLCTNSVDAAECKMISEVLGYTGGAHHSAQVPLNLVTVLFLYIVTSLI